MAKNKYTSINFNHIYDKSFTSNNSDINTTRNRLSPAASSYSAASYSAVSSPNKSHGRMLVLTRSTPKPVASPQQASTTVSQPQQTPLQQPAKSPLRQRTGQLSVQQQLQKPLPDQTKGEPGSDAISLRPLGGTGTDQLLPSPVLNHDKDQEISLSHVTFPKPDKFIPPHLRPGYVREGKSVLEPIRYRDAGHRDAGRSGGYSDYYGEDVRPKSGGGRMRRGGSSDVGIMGRPRSSGGRPRSSGC